MSYQAGDCVSGRPALETSFEIHIGCLGFQVIQKLCKSAYTHPEQNSRHPLFLKERRSMVSWFQSRSNMGMGVMEGRYLAHGGQEAEQTRGGERGKAAS